MYDSIKIRRIQFSMVGKIQNRAAIGRPEAMCVLRVACRNTLELSSITPLGATKGLDAIRRSS